MQLSLLLYSGASDGDMLSNLFWLLAFASWIPQLLGIVLIFRYREKMQLGLFPQLLLLLVPFALIGSLLSGLWVWGLLFLMYADMDLGAWIFWIVSPTVAGAFLIVVTWITNQSSSEAEAASASAAPLTPPAPTPPLPRRYWLAGLAFAGMLITFTAVQVYKDSGPDPVDEYQDSSASVRAAIRARQDSILWHQEQTRTQAYLDSMARQPIEPNKDSW